MAGGTLGRWARVALAVAGGGSMLLTAEPAAAQSDVRMIRPDVMLLLDTSGSMEWRTGVDASQCTGADGGACDRCSNGATMCPTGAPVGGNGQPYVTSGGTNGCPAAEQKNRWITAVEVLTGTIQNFSCVGRARNDSLSYDFQYPIEYHEPLSNGVPLWKAGAVQTADGVLDSYRDRVRFGLMTFDNDYRTGLLQNNGMYSYGADRNYRANGCTDPATPINVGARRSSTGTLDPVPGALVSVGPPLADSVQMAAINDTIQQAIIGRDDPTTPQLAIRPYGGTPIAGMLDDALFYWTTNTDVSNGSATSGIGDPYFSCRSRFNILITDGAPNMDFRPVCQNPSGGGTGQCPYNTPDQTAMAMAMTGGNSPGAKTFVIAFNANDTATRAALEPIAVAGGTTSVLYASNRTGLQTALSDVLDRISSQTSTRTAPAFGVSSSSATSSTLYQFQSSFAVNAGYPWEGILERRRSVCQGTPPAPVDVDLDPAQDDFGALLRADRRAAHGWPTRRLWTWVPPGATSVANMRASMAWSTGQATRYDLNSGIAPALWGVATATDRDTLYAWLRGDSGTVRYQRPLGDIFHSNPLVVAPPGLSLPDQTFSQYRQRALPIGSWRTTATTVGARESVVYVGTNDGILHAFNADTGEEIWGFVPPYLTGSIVSMYPANHQSGVDGTPVARDVVYTRTGSSLGSGSSWQTVLVVGLRGGGPAYVALDVTDPYDPKFLWQFTDADMVQAYGTPAIGTVYTDWNATATTERAVAILPGGPGTLAATCPTTSGIRPAVTDNRISLPAGSAGRPRTRVRCWSGVTGQYLYVVDQQTGRLIGKYGPTGSPIVGSPSLYIGTEGSVSTRAYVGDADGGIWRLDMSDRDPTQWKFAQVFDLFWDAAYDQGQPVVAPPTVSVDHNGDTLIAVGSGDPDLLEGFDSNRVATYREALTVGTGGAVTSILPSRVWELALSPSDSTRGMLPGERLTGALSLFNGVLYFGTFVPANSSDACQLGYSRLWGVDETSVSGTLPDPRLDLDGDPATTSDVVRVTQDINGNGTLIDDANSVLFGVGIVRRPSCVTLSPSIDPVTGMNRSWVDGINGGDFRLVAQTGRGGGTTAGGSRTNVVSRRLVNPIVTTQINSWAAVFE